MSKPTSGPWFWHKGYHTDPGNYSELSNSKEEGEGDRVAASCDGCAIIRNEADARLIAAAPELLDACKMAFLRLNDTLLGGDGAHRELVNQLRIAIELANTNESD